MIDVQCTWEEFKAQAASRKLPMQCFEKPDAYLLWTFDGQLAFSHIIDKDEGADQVEFETSYLSKCNDNALQVKPFADARGFRARLLGWQAVAPAGTTENLDHLLTEERYITGAQLIIKDAVWGDKVSLQIVDVDGIYAPAGTVLDSFVTDWNIAPDKQDQGSFNSAYAAKLLAGLYIRLKYTSVGESNVGVHLNFWLHKKT